MRACVIGIGNELRGDDGVGLAVLRELKVVLNDSSIQFMEIGDSLFDIPGVIMRFDIVFILDALPPGSGSDMVQIHHYDADSRPMRSDYSLHDLDLFWQLAYACRNGFCGVVILIGIAAYSLEYRMELSPKLLKFLPAVTSKIAGIIARYCWILGSGINP